MTPHALESPVTMDWYYLENNEQRGPVDGATLKDLRDRSTVADDTLVWRDGMADWQPYASVAPEITAQATGQVPAWPGESVACPSCGSRVARRDLISAGGQTLCPLCRDRFVQEVREGLAHTGGWEFATIWHRFLADVVDALLLGAVSVVLNGIVGALMFPAIEGDDSGIFAILFAILYFLLSFGIPAAYYIGFHGNPRHQATPGKKLFKIRVIRVDGGDVSYLLATGRMFGELLSAMILYIGYIMAFFDDERASLHDQLCKTRVIRQESPR